MKKDKDELVENGDFKEKRKEKGSEQAVQKQSI